MKRRNIVLITILIIIIIILVILRLVTENAPRTAQIAPAPSPSPTDAFVPTTSTAASFSVKNRLIKRLPVVTDEYTIQYLIKSDTFLVTILLNPYKEYKNQAVAWFVQNGIQDPSVLNIQWNSIRGVSAAP